MSTEWSVKTIVVGVDGSPSSDNAVEMATSIARTRQAKVHFVTVVRPPEGWWGIVGAPPTAGAVADAITEAQHSVLDDALSHVNLEGVEYEVTTAMGDPSRELLSICSSEDADLLIVGRRGAGLVERVMLGSVATRVTVHTDIPVLIVP